MAAAKKNVKENKNVQVVVEVPEGVKPNPDNVQIKLLKDESVKDNVIFARQMILGLLPVIPATLGVVASALSLAASTKELKASENNIYKNV